MLDLRQYASLGAALKDALEHWPNETCLIEADRDREKMRLTYSDFKEMARPLCRALARRRFQGGGPGGDHHDQSVEVADFGILDFLLWRRAGSAGLQIDCCRTFATAGPFKSTFSGCRILPVAGDHAITGVRKTHGRDCAGNGSAGGSGLARRLPLGRIPAQRGTAVRGAATGRHSLHRLLVGDGRASEGMRAHARRLSGAVHFADGLVSLLAGRALFEHSANESCD